MDDPWDVKSVRKTGHYTSCMKLNGAPLLPPVLSKECRKEMQYYKLLAMEVEKRISILRPYIDSDTDSNEDNTDAPEISESEQNYELARDNLEANFDVSIDRAVAKQTNISVPLKCGFYEPTLVTTTDASKFVLDFSLSINQTGRNVLETVKRKSPCPIDLPERDYNCLKNKEFLLDVGTNSKKRNKYAEETANFNFVDKDELSERFLESPSSQDGPPSLSTKSFTCSLIDLHSESGKGSQVSTQLARQRSYTLLKPSPQLLAHLEVQSLNTGVEMSCISMSESLSNLSTPNKKRRSWDLESAKVKWSSMALELKHKQLPNSKNPAANKTVRTAGKKTTLDTYSPPRARSVVPERNRRISTPSKATPKSELLQKRGPSPLIPSNVTGVKGPTSPKLVNQKKESLSPKSPSPQSHKVSESEDPATKVRELYEKIQKQQLTQMTSLVEKQKREQMLLQQVFEEQNSLLFKQLKTIVPTTPVEVKEAWLDKTEAERGPVSLSQLINQKSDQSSSDSPVTSTLTDTNNCISRCDNVLKKSRDLSTSIRKPKSAGHTGARQSPRHIADGSRTRTHSPVQRNTSRRLNYDTSASSEREYDPILTDRTNDTMADLNVTFPTDNSDNEPYSPNNTVLNHTCGNEVTVIHASSRTDLRSSSTDSAIKCMERTIQNSINNCPLLPKANFYCQPAPTPRERVAASRIVACAKGFLVRRLMRTARVRATVQTIRDALLCALQLHQDRAGIRGADVDLHRRLIQQITAACYSLHDTFIASSPQERCAMLAADRARRRSLAKRSASTRHSGAMSQSHSGAFPARPQRSVDSLMTQSTYEIYSSDKAGRSRYVSRPRRRPWR